MKKILQLVRQFAATGQGSLVYRFVISNYELAPWSNWLIAPSDHYLETEYDGPYAIREITAIEINPLQIKDLGVMLPATPIDHTAQLKEQLNVLQIPFSFESGICIILIKDL